MAERVYDRRGRKNWADDLRSAEDQRVSARRADERRARDRRQTERRAHAADTSDPAFTERRHEDRRKGDRRTAPAAITTVRQMLGERWGQVHTLPVTSTVREAVDFLTANGIGLVVISTEQGGLVGVLSERDVVRALAERGADGLYQPVESLMTRGVWACAPDDTPESVLLLMAEHRMRHLPVLDEGRLIGMVSATDLLDDLARRLSGA